MARVSLPQSLCYTLIAFKSIALQNLYGKQDLSLILNTKVSANLNLHLFLQENIQPCGYGFVSGLGFHSMLQKKATPDCVDFSVCT
uniref:Uncharacterized protein n=1 Tax=Anas platyrhynchos platyrhynchos TaxID=8840 RepID=A0A493TBV6_ANAPP